MTQTKERKKMVRFSLVLLLLVFLTFFAISGTLSKYIATKDATASSVRVAKFNVGASFDLFKTADTLKAGVIWSENSDQTIAPGSAGTFVIDTTTGGTGSEVKIDVSNVTFNVVKSDPSIPIEFSTDGGSTWLPTLTSATPTAGVVNVKWRWAFERGTGGTLTTNDGTDTTLGTAGTATVTVNSSATFTQAAS